MLVYVLLRRLMEFFFIFYFIGLYKLIVLKLYVYELFLKFVKILVTG